MDQSSMTLVRSADAAAAPNICKHLLITSDAWHKAVAPDYHLTIPLPPAATSASVSLIIYLWATITQSMRMSAERRMLHNLRHFKFRTKETRRYRAGDLTV